MEEIDIPQYFLCPISLQIMKDPVTTVTGITYDRKSIEKWLITAVADENSPVCPVTKQPLPRGSDLTPNHMLRRLIQAWCVANANNGIDQIPTPKSAVHRSIVLKLKREVNNIGNDNILLRVNALKKMEELANQSDINRKSMAEAGVPKAMVLFILREGKKSLHFGYLEHALRVLHLTWINPTSDVVENNIDFVEFLLWILKSTKMENVVTNLTLVVLKNVIEVASSALFEKLNLEFFEEMVNVLRNNTSQQAQRSTLRILIQTCTSGRNKMKIVEAGAVFELIEIELSKPEKKVSELLICLLAILCSFADGRQEFLKHAGGVAVVAKRLLRVSPATDDRALCIIESIARFSATREVVMEMLRVSAVSKLCMVLQADCAVYLKKKAREILRLHSDAWSNSPCIQVYLLTRYNR